MIPPVEEVASCPVRLTLQPLLPAGMDAEMAPDSDAVPDMVAVEPEIGAKAPCITPLATVQVNVLVSVEPSDWPPLHVPS